MNDELYTNDKKTENIQQQSGAQHAVKNLYEWTEAAVFSLIVIVALFTFVCRTVGVDGPSMMNTLINGERLLVTSYTYTPARSDIVIVSRENNEPLVKRIIAIGGDKLFIDGETNQVFVNGEPINEPYALGITYPEYYPENEEIVPDGYVFIMGDNRQNSSDSREIGYVHVDRIIGKAFFRIYPFSKFGSID